MSRPLFFVAATFLSVSACSGLNDDTASFIAGAQKEAQAICQYVPTVETVVAIASLVSPSSANVSVLSFIDTAKKICKKVDEFKATARPSSVRGGSQVKVGEIEGVPITGFFVNEPATR
jgi:hypothetical protein